MLNTNAIAETAALIGDPARTNMLAALMDGRALTAAELARVAGITPQTASGHLARLTEAGLLAMERQGRHRYHRLASATIASLLENIMSVAAALNTENGPGKSTLLVTGPRDKALRRARTCYDHLAGEVAVAMADRMVQQGHIEFSPDGGILLESGSAFLASLGVDLDLAKTRAHGRQLFCRPCLDWSERRPHIAGALGTALADACFSKGWMRRVGGSRAVTITPAGTMALKKAFGIAA